jgi:hypothetical protein
MKRNTLILVLIAALCGGYAWYELKKGKERDAAEDTTAPAFTFKAEEVTALTLTSQGKTVVAEKNADGKWVVVQPITSDGDQITIKEVIDTMAGAKTQRLLKASAEEMQSFGLSSPSAVAEMKMKDGQMHRVIFGAKDFSGSSVYAKIDQMTDVAILPVTVQLMAEKKLNDLRDREILKIKSDDLAKVRIRNSSLTVVAERGADGKWLIKEPADKKDKEADGSKLLDSWLSTMSDEIIDAPSPEISAKLNKPAVDVELTAKDSKVTRLKFSAAAGEDAYVGVEGHPQMYKIRKSTLDSLDFKADQIVKAPAPPPPASPAAIALPTPSQ